MKTEEQSSMNHTWNSYAVPTINIVEFHPDSILAESSIEDYDENLIS